MSTVRIATNFNIDIEFISPAFYRRLLAWVIDLVIEVIYLIMAGKFFSWLASNSGSDVDSQYNLQFILLLLLVPFLVYHVVCEVTMSGQSVGKKIMGIRVISENGGKPTFGQYIIRWLIRTSDFMLFTMLLLLPYAQYYGNRFYWGIAGVLALLLADIVLVNSRKQQRLGDILAHTLLIDTKQNESINDTIFLELSEKYIPSFPQVMQLSDRDINSLKGILDTARKRHDFGLAEMASEKIKKHLRIDTTLSPFDFLEVLLKDYNYLSAN
ncbi:MAG TPA: RDD family protein [Flavisolibacter sp.]|nr:RDD family protein [Flavisolibacter sp.]